MDKAEPMVDYDTIDGKWWSFEDGKAVCPLTDEEAAEIIWGIEKHSEPVSYIAGR